MKIIFYIAQIYLGILAVKSSIGCRNRFIKWGLLVVAICFLSFNLYYNCLEKKSELISEQLFQNRTEEKLNKVNEKMDELDKKEEKGPLDDIDYLRYISLNLEKLNINMNMIRRTYKRDFILDYFIDVAKIPDYFNLDEWKETETMIYRRTTDSINGDFNSRGMFDSGLYKKLMEDFKKEREKLIKAKEREFENKE